MLILGIDDHGLSNMWLKNVFDKKLKVTVLLFVLEYA